MGPDTKAHDISKPQLTINGVPVVYGADGNIPTVQIYSEARSASVGEFDAFISKFSMTLRPPKGLRCSSRKRFIKLLMGYGWERNVANMMTEIAQEWGESYQSLILWMWWGDEINYYKKER